ncbi:MAG TPA: hypothetical protein VKB73_09300 [Gaiellaceae bacterium]|nr:hypothetical protein [Gaiellaceae bacterium]
MRLLRSLLVFKLGVWVGMMGAASVMKRALPSVGGADSDEVALTAILDGVDLKSQAKAFKGGSMLAWFGGIDADLREAELAPEARLSLNALWGGIKIETPPGWRVESNVKTLAGGVDVPTAEEADGPVLTVEGMALFGGIQVSRSQPSPTRSEGRESALP